MINRTHKGFTLIETLVAVTVVVTAMIGPLYAVQQSLNASRSAREQLIASSLAQEGVEYVRSIRDGNYLFQLMNTQSGRSWLYGVDGTGGSTNCVSAPCVVDPTQLTVSRVIAPLYLSSGNLYNQAGSGTQTPYTRTVLVTPVLGSTSSEIVLTVVVSWTSRGQVRSVTITERLYNWL